MKTKFLLLFLFLSTLLFAIPGDHIIIEEFWVTLHNTKPGLQSVLDNPDDEIRDAIDRLYGELVFVLSGMIYGFEFRYVPLDRMRQIDEEFDLVPRSLIIRGDPRMRVKASRIENNKLFIQARYTLEDFQASWRDAWQNNTTAFSSARGRAHFDQTEEMRIQAIEAAVKEAIRAYCRPRIANKPAEIKGAVLLQEAPRILVMEGSYLAEVRIKLMIDSFRKTFNP